MNGTLRSTTITLALALMLLAFLPGSAAEVPDAGEPCGPIEDPVCWTARFACYYYGPPVERLVRDTLLTGIDADPEEWKWQACERQPEPEDAAPAFAVGAAFPAPATTAGGDPCGMLDDPACWTVRFACYYAGPPVNRALEPLYPYVRLYFHCPTQPAAGVDALSPTLTE